MLMRISSMHKLIVTKMRKLAGSRKGSSLVLATLLLVIVTLVAGVFFYTNVMGSMTSMTNNINTQMSLLMLEGSKINATCITAFLRNTGQYSVDIVNAYVNSQIAVLAQTVKLTASSLGVAYIGGTYTKGSSYTVKLASIFGTLITFELTY